MKWFDDKVDAALERILERKMSETPEEAPPPPPKKKGPTLDPNWKLTKASTEHPAPLCHELLRSDHGINWFEGFPEPNEALREMLKAGTFPYYEKLNERFKFYCLARWGVESTPDDIRCAFAKLISSNAG